jgi:hypothetical protein
LRTADLSSDREAAAFASSTSADAKIVDVSTLTSLTTGCRIDRTDDFSGRNLDITITDASPEVLTLKSAL